MFKDYIKNNYDKIIAWGTSKYYTDNKNLLNLDYDYFVDNDKNKWGKSFESKPILNPQNIETENGNKTLIVIFSSFYQEIVEQIKGYGNYYYISGYELTRLKDIFNNGGANNTSIIKDLKDKPKVATISRNNYILYLGGTSKFIREQMELSLKMGFVHLHFYWKDISIKEFDDKCIFAVIDGKHTAVFNLNIFMNLLDNIKVMFIHNLIGLDLNIFNKIYNKKLLTVPTYYYIHDFSCICRNIKLIYNDEYFCNSFNENWSKCNTCKYGEDKVIIHDFHKEFFERENVHLITPAENTKNIILKSFDKLSNEIQVIPHQTFELEESSKVVVNEKIKFAYVGYKSKFKGWETFEKIVEIYKDEYEFYCMGYSDEILDNVTYVDVSFIEDGEQAMTNKLIEHNIDIAFLWSICPETYSYTYYESGAAGTYIITNDLSGNIKEQIKIYKNGIVFKQDEELIHFLSNKEDVRKQVKQNNVLFSSLHTNIKGMENLLK